MSKGRSCQGETSEDDVRAGAEEKYHSREFCCLVGRSRGMDGGAGWERGNADVHQGVRKAHFCSVDRAIASGFEDGEVFGVARVEKFLGQGLFEGGEVHVGGSEARTARAG